MYTPQADEKLTPVMIYGHNYLIRGEALSKQNVRTSIWLRTDSAPRYMRIFKAHVLQFIGGTPRSYSYTETVLPVENMIGFHMTPPGSEGVDYEEGEKNRVNVPVEALVGPFVFKCKVRLSTQGDLYSSIEVFKSSWLSVYELNITNPLIPQLSLNVEMALIRPDRVQFAFP